MPEKEKGKASPPTEKPDIAEKVQPRDVDEFGHIVPLREDPRILKLIS